ncbi:hypothetical protein [Pilimelia anulata]|uniref:hypothetical protein n=1 Tax=Pilimelia anulata TaxID=53371 RepID=UPI00166E8D87|nr:hypothetical protein [Pilimelia anulata]
MAAGLLTRRMLGGGSWRRLLPDVYLHRDAVLDHRTWIEAAALLLPAGSAVAGYSAAHLWGVDVLPRPPRPAGEPVTVIVPVPRGLPAERVREWQRRLEPGEVTTFAGLPVTTGLRTAFDLGREEPAVGALAAVEALAYRRVVRLGELRELAARRRGWPGAGRLRWVCAQAYPGVGSPMETRLRLLLRAGGLPRPRVQYEVRDPGGRLLGRLDLAYPRERLGVEYDGGHHRARATLRGDPERLNALRVAGWTILRCTPLDLSDPPALTARVATLLGRTTPPPR